MPAFVVLAADDDDEEDEDEEDDDDDDDGSKWRKLVANRVDIIGSFKQLESISI